MVNTNYRLPFRRATRTVRHRPHRGVRYMPRRYGVQEAVRQLFPAVARAAGSAAGSVLGKRKTRSTSKASTKRRGKRGSFTVGTSLINASRKQKIRRDPYKLHGSEKVIEKGGIVTPAVIASWGHSNFPLYEVYLSVGRALWRALMKKHGISFSDWGDTLDAPITLSLSVEYRLAPNGTATVKSNPAYLTPQTHLQWAVFLTGILFDAYTSTDDQLIVYKLFMEDTIRLCELDVTNATLHLRLISDMVMQNRTKGENTGDDQSTDVTNNPIEGRSWTVTGNGMMPLSNKVMSGETVAHQEYGSIIGSQNTTPQGPTTFEPNSAQTYKFALGSAKQRIMPGQISRSKLVSVYKMSLQQFIEKTKDYLGQNTSANATNLVRVPVGKSRMFSFEKVCDTGAGDQLVTLGYEINNGVSSYLTVKNPYTNRIGQKF